MWLKAVETLRRICDMAEEEYAVFALENLNLPLDRSGVPFARAEDTTALAPAIERPRFGLNLDLDRAQIGEGNLIELRRSAQPWIGEIQVADVPGRREPRTGEINCAGIARALAAMGYAGPVGLEAWASGQAEAALEAFRTAFTT